MRKERMLSFVMLAVALVTVLSLPQAYAKTNYPGPQIGPPQTMALISSVTNPAGGCGYLGLSGIYGYVEYGNGKLTVGLQNAHPSSTYTVTVAKYSQGSCDGSWQSIGSLSTDHAGNGLLAQKSTLQYGQNYVFEFKDAQGNLVYAATL